MVSRAIFLEFPENTHSTFRDCHVHFCTFFRQPFSKELYVLDEIKVQVIWKGVRGRWEKIHNECMMYINSDLIE